MHSSLQKCSVYPRAVGLVWLLGSVACGGSNSSKPGMANDSPPPSTSTSTSTSTGNVSTITVPGFLDDRRVWVYLPPGYEDAPEMRYPVLYMLDGQNVFDRATSFAGEWRVDESCEALITASQMQPIIVVAVDNAGKARIDEYMPWFDRDWHGGAGGKGDDFLQVLRNVLVPYVDQRYRTLAEPESRGIGGSSAGGLLALYAGYTYPETFGRIAALSSALDWDDQHILRLAKTSTRPAGTRVYMDMGTLEEGQTVDEDGDGLDDHVGYQRALREIMVGQGLALDRDLMVVEDQGGQHREAYWAARFPAALKFLFPPQNGYTR